MRDTNPHIFGEIPMSCDSVDSKWFKIWLWLSHAKPPNLCRWYAGETLLVLARITTNPHFLLNTVFVVGQQKKIKRIKSRFFVRKPIFFWGCIFDHLYIYYYASIIMYFIIIIIIYHYFYYYYLYYYYLFYIIYYIYIYVYYYCYYYSLLLLHKDSQRNHRKSSKFIVNNLKPS